MMSDVLSQLDDCNRREQESNIENGGSIDGIAVCRFKGPEKSKFGIIQKTGKFDLTEFIDKRLEIKNLHVFHPGSFSDNRQKERKQVAGADTDDKGNEF